MRVYPFSEVVTDATSKFRKIKASDYKTEGRFKIIDQGQKDVAGFTNDESLINTTHLPIIVFGDHTRALKYEESPIALGADGAKALSVNPALANALYVYYYLRTINLKGAGYSRHFKFLKQVKIPIPENDGKPDFGAQERIAHLLGKVENLIAQRKQHLKQLDDLLKSVFLDMFGDPVQNEKGWDTLPFSKVGRFLSGGTPSKARDDFWNGNFPWVSPKDMKTEKIDDSIDHISETVFEETSLKRVSPGHLLVVVRGMILAHSFPVAINSVEIAINQDMKAITPVKEINVVYLQHCLNSLKRQILSLISSAGHGTRKFDSDAMHKLHIPKPPEKLQIQFVSIAEKLEGLKVRYQKSLTDLKSLYGALSQQAFKGELDLSRVSLSDIEKESVDISQIPTASTQTLELSKNAIAQLNDFNEKHSTILKALKDSSALAPLEMPALKAAREMAEQASLWRTPLDELKNMISIARATEELTASSGVQKLAQEMASINEVTKLAKQIAESLPKVDMGWLKEQQALVETATQPFKEMQNSMAALALQDETVRALKESDNTMRSLQAALPNTVDWMPQFPTPAVSMSREDEDEPRYIFTRHDVLQALAEEPSLSLKGLMGKLTRLEVITQQGYERIKKLIFELLNEGEIEQHYNDEDNSVALKALA